MGSVTYITDGDGKVESRYAYDAWGNVTESEEGIGNRFRFTGQQYDPVTQQYYLRARFYNPVIARFTQEDTYRGAGLNLYAYCDNNPVAYVDPSGHQPSCVKDAAKKYMEQGMSKEEAYRKAYADHADDKLKDPSNLSAKEKYELEQRQKRLGNQPNTPTVQGPAEAPHKGVPNSIYERVDNENPSIITSRTFYDENGNGFSRQDYYRGSDPHTHFDKSTSTSYTDHEHVYVYTPQGYIDKKRSYVKGLDTKGW